MSSTTQHFLLSQDAGLLEHWQRSLPAGPRTVLSQFADLATSTGAAHTLVWLDLALPQVAPWRSAPWHALIQQQQRRIVATSSTPNDAEGVAALDTGCVGYCQAFSNAATLAQVGEVVLAGQVWVGQSVLQRLIQNAAHVATLTAAPRSNWAQDLTQREREVAALAANGASNHAIATQCQITERTVKAHLSAVFDKLAVSDRLQLALRVHGIS
mgnify:CR=1 FL=1